MSLLAFGGEMGFFVPADANAIEATTANRFDSSFARCASAVTGDASYLLTPEVTAQTSEFWFHFDINMSSPFSSDSNLQKVLELLDSSGNARVRLRTTYLLSGQGTWELDYWDGAAWQSAGDCVATVTGVQTIDIRVAGINGASGTLAMYMSGTQRIGSGTLDLSAVDDLAQGKCWGRITGIALIDSFSQIIIANESTVGMKVGAIVMTGQGATHTFDTGGFANVDEPVYSDADLWSSATANQVELCTGTPVPSFTGYVIRALGIYARAKKSGSGPAQMQLALRSAGTTYFSATMALGFGYDAIGNVWETNPATPAVAFLGSAIASLEYGVKSIT